MVRNNYYAITAFVLLSMCGCTGGAWTGEALFDAETVTTFVEEFARQALAAYWL